MAKQGKTRNKVWGGRSQVSGLTQTVWQSADEDAVEMVAFNLPAVHSKIFMVKCFIWQAALFWLTLRAKALAGRQRFMSGLVFTRVLIVNKGDLSPIWREGGGIHCLDWSVKAVMARHPGISGVRVWSESAHVGDWLVTQDHGLEWNVMLLLSVLLHYTLSVTVAVGIKLDCGPIIHTEWQNI